MASYDPQAKKQKMTEATVKKGAIEKAVPWQDVAPQKITDWLDIFAQANNTTKDILLASILPTTACLMGNTSVKVDCKLRPEQVNLIMVCLSAPGSGKSPAFHNACSCPIRLHVEEQRATQLFVDEFTEAGLFQQLKASDGHKAIVGKEEVSQFFETLLSKEKAKVDVERLIQLYDGATWVYTKGNSKARQVVDNPGVSIVGYSQPDRFFPLYSKLKERKDGAVDRLLVYQPKPHRLSSAETKEYIKHLNDSSVKDLRMVYEDIYHFCHKEDEVLTLMLDDEANKEYELFVDNIASKLNKQWEENNTEDNVSKADRHVIRLGAVLHVLFHHLMNRLNKQKASPPPIIISKSTLQQAITLEAYFATQRKILDQLIVTDDMKRIGKGGNGSVAKAVLESEGPFTSVSVVQKSKFSHGRSRPSAGAVIEAMHNLEKDGLGVVKVVDRTTVFYKELPTSTEVEVLSMYSVSKELYAAVFTKRAPPSLMSKDLFNKILKAAPKCKELKEAYYITEDI